MFSALGSVDCVGCSSAEDEMPNDSSPIQTKERKRKPSKTLKLLNHDNMNALLRLSIMIFTKNVYSNQTLALAAQLIAEVCREIEGRKMALKYKSQVSLVQSLGQLLSRPRSTETCVQVCIFLVYSEVLMKKFNIMIEIVNPILNNGWYFLFHNQFYGDWKKFRNRHFFKLELAEDTKYYVTLKNHQKWQKFAK